MISHRHWLLRIPSAIYGMAVGVRNFAYDKGWLSSIKFSIPTICVGNLAVGGTGKTPHIELLIRLLKDEYKIALLSRGYGRITKQPIIASDKDTALSIGDEPFQIKRKFPEIMVYIDGNRRRALRRIEEMPEGERPDVVLMDDGFQHRAVTPSYSILLTSFNNLYSEDYFLPYGSLRDGAKEASRADTIIITNTPRQVNAVDLRIKKDRLNLLAYQDQHFSRVKYESPKCVFEDIATDTTVSLLPLQLDSSIMVLTGIARPEVFQSFCEEKFNHILSFIEFPDHHIFTKDEILGIISRMNENPDAFILTTEKDAVRFQEFEKFFSEDLKRRMWYIPIYIDISLDSRIRLLRKAKRAIKNNGLTI